MKDLESLIISAMAGDVAAFEQIVLRFQGMAVGYAFAILGDFHLAEDAAQEAFVEAYAKLDSLREPRAFANWLKRIVFKHCDRLTRGARVPTVPMPAIDLPDAAPLPIDKLEGTELRNTVVDSIRHLGDNERPVVTLFYMGDYSHKDIAGFLDLRVSTVKSRLHSARAKLKERLMTMVEDVLKQNAPDESFAKRVADAVELYSSKGPTHDSTRSEWDLRLRAQTRDLLRSGEEGFKIAVELSHSNQVRPRANAAIYFALKRDPRGRDHLKRLLKDESSTVRNRALRAYAALIHPEPEAHSLWAIGTPAKSLPEGIEAFFPMIEDQNVKVRMYAVTALGAYVGLGDERIEQTLRKALDDPKHKIRHAAAHTLSIPCPDCPV
jgi:RNA polymerase sigma factor (sigma-70 family)